MKHFISKIAYSNYLIIHSVLHSNYSNSKISIRFSPNVCVCPSLSVSLTCAVSVKHSSVYTY